MKTEIKSETINNFLKKYKDQDEIEKINKSIYFVNTKYQRNNNIWKTNDVKEKLITSILRKYPIGNIILWDTKTEMKNMEIVDGQQRIYVIKKFIKGDIRLKENSINELLEDENFKKEIEIIQNKIEKDKIEKILKGYKKSIIFKDLPDSIQTYFKDYDLPLIKIEGKKKEISDYFIALQNQEKLSAGEIINASIYSEINIEINKIFKNQDNINKFVKLINFKDNRKDFLKILSSFFLINQNEISLGTSGTEILKKLNKFDKKVFEENKDNFKSKIEELSKNIENTNKEEWNFEKPTSKNAIKIFFLGLFFSKSSTFQNKNLKEKIIISKNIANLTKIFSSEKENGKKSILESYKKNIKKIWEILEKTRNKEKLVDVIQNNFDKLISDNNFLEYLKYIEEKE